MYLRSYFTNLMMDLISFFFNLFMQDNIHIVEERVPNDISSTRIRKAIRRKESIRYFVPDPVIQYISENKLYHEENELK